MNRMDAVYSAHKQSLEANLQRLSQLTYLRLSELVIVAVYPITVLLGQLIHICTGDVDNYFTNKYNVFNLLFVKQGWAWTLALVAVFIFQHYGFSIKVALRVAMATIWWYVFTQRFFGLPLMDRVFLWTGGGCNYELNYDLELDIVVGSIMCRKMQGTWIGGHDPSGHVFLLVHSSLAIWFELVECGVLLTDLKKLRVDYDRLKNQQGGYLQLSLIVLTRSTLLLLLLLGLWWWMLLMTSIHFHSFAEKLTGLAAGYIGLLIYIIPRFF